MLKKGTKMSWRAFAAAATMAFVAGGFAATGGTPAHAAEDEDNCSDRGCILDRCYDADGYDCWEVPGPKCTGSSCGS